MNLEILTTAAVQPCPLLRTPQHLTPQMVGSAEDMSPIAAVLQHPHTIRMAKNPALKAIYFLPTAPTSYLVGPPAIGCSSS